MAGVVGESCWARLAIVLESPFSDSEHVQDCVSSCLKALQHIAGAGAALTPELRSRLRIGLHEYIALEGTEALELDAAKLRSALRAAAVTSSRSEDAPIGPLSDACVADALADTRPAKRWAGLVSGAMTKTTAPPRGSPAALPLHVGAAPAIAQDAPEASAAHEKRGASSENTAPSSAHLMELAAFQGDDQASQSWDTSMQLQAFADTSPAASGSRSTRRDRQEGAWGSGGKCGTLKRRRWEPELNCGSYICRGRHGGGVGVQAQVLVVNS